MVSTDSTSTGNTQASRLSTVSVAAAAYWWTAVFGDPVVMIITPPGGGVYGLDGNRNMSVLIPTARPPPPVIWTTLAAASMSSLPGHRGTCRTVNVCSLFDRRDQQNGRDTVVWRTTGE